MKRRLRLRKRADIERVRALKRSWAHPLLVLYVAPNDLGITRIGVSVSRKVGSAVVRNRVKRRIREAARLRYEELVQGYDLLFIARPAAAEADWQAIREAVDSLLRRARLLKAVSAAPAEGASGR